MLYLFYFSCILLSPLVSLLYVFLVSLSIFCFLFFLVVGLDFGVEVWVVFGVLLGILVLHLWQRVEVRITFDLPKCKSEEDKITGCVAKEYYESGEVFREVPLKNGVIDGVTKEYYKSGKILRELLHKNGVGEGISKEYYENGNLKAEVTYHNGKANGVSKMYYENGGLWREIL